MEVLGIKNFFLNLDCDGGYMTFLCLPKFIEL